MIQPFYIIEGLSYMKYGAWFTSDSSGKLIQDRERYEVIVSIDPWGKLKEFTCECKGFKFGKGKRICRHISNDDVDNPGLLQTLLNWGEIEEIPEIESEVKDGLS